MNILIEGLKDAIPIIAKFSPVISSVIGGVPGVAASSALSLLSHAFNSSPSDLPGLASSIINDPDVESKLKSLEEAHSSWLPYVNNIGKLKKVDLSVNIEWDNSKDGN